MKKHLVWVIFKHCFDSETLRKETGQAILFAFFTGEKKSVRPTGWQKKGFISCAFPWNAVAFAWFSYQETMTMAFSSQSS